MAASGQSQDDCEQYPYADIDVHPLLLDPLMIAAQEISSAAGCKSRNYRNIVLDREMNAAEAGLEDHAHVQYQQQKKINSIAALLEKRHGYKVRNIKE